MANKFLTGCAMYRKSYLVTGPGIGNIAKRGKMVGVFAAPDSLLRKAIRIIKK